MHDMNHIFEEQNHKNSTGVLVSCIGMRYINGDDVIVGYLNPKLQGFRNRISCVKQP